MKAIIFGEILWDVINGTPHLGGAPLNYAYHIHKCGIEAEIISALGRDELGDRAKNKILELGLEPRLIQQNEYPTGTVDVVLDNGQPSYNIREKVAYDHIQKFQKENFSADLFYFGSLCQRSYESRSTLWDILNTYGFKHIFFDVNLRKPFFNEEIIRHSLKKCTILKVNDEECEQLGMMLYQRIMPIEKFCELVFTDCPELTTIIVTLGSKGCRVLQRGLDFRLRSESVKVKDTIGAGDSFAAGFCAKYLQHGKVKEAAKFAVRLGAMVASSQGATPNYNPSSI